MNDGQVPTSMTEGCTVTIVNGKSKGTVVGNYRPIVFLQLMWKCLIRTIIEAMYGHFE